MDDLHEHFKEAADRLLLKEEKLYSLGDAATFLARSRGEKVSPSALCRWIIRGKDGVRLDAVKCNGGGWWTSREALARFAASLSAKAIGNRESAPTQTALDRRAESAKARLRSRGVRC